MKKVLLLLLSFFFFQLSAKCQNKSIIEKIDPFLLQLIESHLSTDSLKQVTSETCGNKKKDTKNLKKKMFDCIVYTDKPQALKDSGIVVNSILPTFVTAQATAEQILKMSQMASVRYISPSGKIEKEIHQ